MEVNDASLKMYLPKPDSFSKIDESISLKEKSEYNFSLICFENHYLRGKRVQHYSALYGNFYFYRLHIGIQEQRHQLLSSLFCKGRFIFQVETE